VSTSSRPARACHGRGIIGHVRVRVEEGFFEIFEPRVIQVELPLQRAIRHASTALEHGQGLIENLLEGHGRPSTALARMPRESNVCRRTNVSTEPSMSIHQGQPGERLHQNGPRAEWHEVRENAGCMT
jgi:hypothetical protein